MIADFILSRQNLKRNKRGCCLAVRFLCLTKKVLLQIFNVLAKFECRKYKVIKQLDKTQTLLDPRLKHALTSMQYL